MKVLLLNGPNMNVLGKRNPFYYGYQTLAEVEKEVISCAARYDIEIVCRQSNSEGALLDILQNVDCDAAIFNAAAYSHYSYALRDCIECLPYPVVEVHMSDPSQRKEAFRHVDVLRDVCNAYFCGNGVGSYLQAVEFLAKMWDKR